MPERTVDTAQGEVSYETVTCQSCGDEVAKEGASRCVIGEITDEKYWSHKKSTDIEFEGRPHSGWLCNFCHENPAAYPHKNDKPDWHSKCIPRRERSSLMRWCVRSVPRCSATSAKSSFFYKPL